MKRKKPYSKIIEKLTKQMEKLEYSKYTVRSYEWQAKRFLENLSTSPERVTEAELKKYFERIQEDEMSKPYFLQATTTAELIFDYVVKRNESLPLNFFSKVRRKYLKNMTKSVEKKDVENSL